MKTILLHSDFIEFEPKSKAIKSAEPVDKKIHKVKDCLVVFSAVEKKDESDVKGVAKSLEKEVSDVAKEVKTKKIVLYPWVHLTSEPSSPGSALEVMKLAEKKLSKKFEVIRAPFGWYKAFNIKCKGHPLAELSREFGAAKADDVSDALKAEDTLKSRWCILDAKGKLHDISIDKNRKVSGFDFSKFKNLEKFVQYEMAKSREVKEEPPHVALMKKLQLADYEPGSDPGNLRYPPKGRLIKALLEEWVNRKVLDYGAMEIEAPIMYDFEHPSLKAYMNRFPARQYTIQTPNKKVFLRFAACFGQFLMAHDATLSYKHMPLRMYELTKYSFRVEKRGELTGLRRLRAFTMPDCHALCATIPQAKDEMLKRLEMARKVQEGMGLNVPGDFELAIRVVKSFWDKNKDFVQGLVKKFGKPALIEMWDKQFFYFVLKYEWNFVDALDKASCLTTDQIDIENGERYDLLYTDSDGKKKHPYILHLSPSGAIERVMYALLEREYMRQKEGKTPVLPLWLSPTQVRICPVSDKHLKFAEKIADKLEGVRAEVDDRDMTLGKKIMNSGQDWVPYTVVVGDNEVKSGKLSVTVRESGKKLDMKADDLAKEIRKKTEGKPFRPLPLGRMMSKQPIFMG